MKRCAWHLVTTVLLAVLALGKGEVTCGAGEVPWGGEPLQVQHVQADNLLVNGSMEEGFYWKYPNHYVANGWLRWIEGSSIPEYDDVREWRPYRYDGNHAQVYFKWGASYTAGIYQRVPVRPCTFYQFSMYGRNHSDAGLDHHARIGIDPLGRQYNTANNPFVSSLPSDTVWSSEQTFFYTWGLHTVTAESRSDHVTVVTYVSPDHCYTPYDTFWDAGTLVEVPLPPGRLPDPPSWDPDGLITEVVSYTQSGQLVIEWETTEPALTQVWYRVITPTLPITSTGTGSLLLPTVYLPLVTNWRSLDLYTPVDQTGGTHHRAVIQWLEEGQNIRFVILARHLVSDTCRTSPSFSYKTTIGFSKPIVPPPQNSAGDVEVRQ